MLRDRAGAQKNILNQQFMTTLKMLCSSPVRIFYLFIYLFLSTSTYLFIYVLSFSMFRF